MVVRVGKGRVRTLGAAVAGWAEWESSAETCTKPSQNPDFPELLRESDDGVNAPRLRYQPSLWTVAALQRQADRDDNQKLIAGRQSVTGMAESGQG